MLESLALIAVYGFVFVLGSAVGSFLNVVVYRLPAGLSLLYPPSRCPHCLHPLGKTENVPILGWLWLKGRCRWCRSPISPRYPLVEALTGLLFCLVAARYGPTIQALGYSVLVSFLVALALIDWDTLTLPGILTKTGLVVGLSFQALWGWQGGQGAGGLVAAVGAAVLGLWGFDLLRWGGTFWLQQEAMGDGDPKLAAMLGAWLGWQLLALTAFLACLLGLLGVGVAAALGRFQSRQFPFGPCLAAGGIISLLAGEAALSAYKAFFFPQL